VVTWFYRFATGIQIGSITLSLTGIFWGIVVFIVGFFITRWFQGWLDGSVMARGKVDAGVRNSIRTVVGYAGIALAGLVALSAAGIDFSNLALIAGGLSLGIGFGLQNVVSNFVSGLILLAERPFKSGDWIVAGPVSGTVKKISVRATEIETFQRQTVILPNSELINSAVGNWTHKNKLGRIEIPIGVAYGSDARKVHRLLMELAASHPLVLKNPEPFVLFASFGDSSLNFEIRVFLADIANGVVVQNELRFAILETFARENIEIPFPQREIRIVGQQQPETWPTDDDRAGAELEEAQRLRAEEQVDQVARSRRRRKPDPA
jgi:small-conductance mechanosensitive channel